MLKRRKILEKIGNKIGNPGRSRNYKFKVGRILKLYFVLLMKSHLQSYPCPLQINSGNSVVLEINLHEIGKGSSVRLGHKTQRTFMKRSSLW